MQITVTVPDEFARQAEARGVPVEAFAEQVLAGVAGTTPPIGPGPEAVDAMLGFAAAHGLKLREGERITDLIREARKHK